MNEVRKINEMRRAELKSTRRETLELRCLISGAWKPNDMTGKSRIGESDGRASCDRRSPVLVATFVYLTIIFIGFLPGITTAGLR